MNLYNIEIFQPDFTYRDSCQTNDIEYEYDYLSISKNKIKLLNIKAEKGDYIRIFRNKMTLFGIIEGVTESVTSTTLEFKHILSIMDIDVYADSSIVANTDNPVEQWIADIITDTYINNPDRLQNITGLEVKCTSSTTGTKKLGLDGNINNLYEIIQNALIKHDVVIRTDIDIQNKKIVMSIGQNTKKEKVIESDLPNVLDKEFNIKKSDGSVNKLTLINEDDESQQVTYYLLQNGSITTDSNSNNRIIPVVNEIRSISLKKDETFESRAYQEALDKLVPEEYDNLIEITVESNDTLICPEEMQIGQKATILHNGIEYHTMLTGIERKDRIKLMFGTIRLELTKKMKRRIKK